MQLTLDDVVMCPSSRNGPFFQVPSVLIITAASQRFIDIPADSVPDSTMPTGFEIADAALAVLPLLIEALKLYGDGVGTILLWRMYR
jgi:hypothetical protein